MKCYVVQDLLPEYVEGLCREETAKEIKQHLEGCEECQGIWKNMSESDGASGKMEMQKIQPFQKIKKEIKKNKRGKWVAIVLLVLVCAVFGTLTVGQIFPALSCPSYDTIYYHHRAKQIATQLVEGDIETVMKGMGARVTNERAQDQVEFYHDTVDQIKNLQRKVFDGKDVSIKVGTVTYEQFLYSDEDFIPQTDYRTPVTITYNGKKLYLTFLFYEKNYYSLMVSDGKEDFNRWGMTEEESQNENTVHLRRMFALLDFYYCASRQDNIERLLLSHRISRITKEDIDKMKQDDLEFHTLYIVEKCNEFRPKNGSDVLGFYTEVQKKVYNILRSCQENTLEITDGEYDTEKKAFNATFYWTLIDRNGKTAVMTQKFYYGMCGYEPVQGTAKVYADAGFDQKVKEKLKAGF